MPDLCDIYGAGWTNELGKSYKESEKYHNNVISNNTKYDGLINYKYSLCVENCLALKIIFRKFTDSILCWTIPIYYGCTNISEYFPKHHFIM